MEFVVQFFLTFCVSYFVLSILVSYFTRRKELKAELEDRIYRKLDEIVHRVKVENHHGHTYWFDQDNDRFLAQGETQDELIAVLKKRFPEHIFYLNTKEVVAASTNWKLATDGKVRIESLNLD